MDERFEDKVKLHNRDRIGLLAVVLTISLLACRPVITVGWGEILIVTAVLLFVLAPLLIRIMRLRTDNQKDKKDRGKE